MADTQGDVTRLLRRLDGGEREALREVLPLVYDELRALAAARLARERPDHTLQPTALVHEAWMRLASKPEPHWQDRQHFLRAAAAVMRCILVDHARHCGRQKRTPNGDGRSPCTHLGVYHERALDLLALDEALERLADMAPRQADIIELHFFAGLTMKEAGEVLGISERTAHADWRLARAWLWRELQES
jgi:RNA polymerase sigma factor (TIGR02999 family)